MNEERTYQNNISEDISSHKNSADIINHACDDSGINVVNTEEEVDFTCIHSNDENNGISMNDDDNLPINIMHHFYW